VGMLPQVVPNLPKNLKMNDVERALFHFFPNSTIVNEILQEYPPYQFDNCPKCVISAILKDYFFVCSSRRTLLAMQAQGVQAYMYHFTYDGVLGDNLWGVYHGAELPFVFDNEWPVIINTFNANDKVVADIFGTYWTNFAKYGNPNGHGTPVHPYWPHFQPNNQANLILQLHPTIEQQLAFQQCNFWDSMFPYYGRIKSCQNQECLNHRCKKHTFRSVVKDFLLALKPQCESKHHHHHTNRRRNRHRDRILKSKEVLLPILGFFH